VPMKPAAVAGFTVLALVVGAAFGYFAWRRAMQRKKARYQRLLVRRIAKEIKWNPQASVGPSQEDLVQAFKKIDVSDDGFIEKEELRAFLSSGSMSGEGGSMKAIPDSDLNALFAALDPKERGKVNFLDFCTFLSECDNASEVATVGEIDREIKECDDEQRLERIAKRLSSRQLALKE